jgi:hypothetical protein
MLSDRESEKTGSDRKSQVVGSSAASGVDAYLAEDKNKELLLKHPGLNHFWDGKKWVVSHERFRAVASAADITLAKPQQAGPQDLFATHGSYDITGVIEITEAKTSVVSEPIVINEVVLILGNALVEALGGDESRIEGDNCVNTGPTVLPCFDCDVPVEVIRVDVPDEHTCEREFPGSELLAQVRAKERDAEAAKTDKVGQRNIASQITSEMPQLGIEQPRYLDARSLNPPPDVVRFSKIDLSAFPLEEIKAADPSQKRVWVFEDTYQGFAVVHDGEQRYVASFNPTIKQFAGMLGLTRSAYGGDQSVSFDMRLSALVRRLHENPAFSVSLLDYGSERPSSNDLKTAAQEILGHPTRVYLKSSRSSRGELVLRISRDENDLSVIESDSSEVGELLANYTKAVESLRLQRGDFEVPYLSELAKQVLQSSGSVEGFLARVLVHMETPILEEEIPVTRYKTKLGSEKAEFRMIMQGRDEPTLVAHYAKASLNDIAGNISLQGWSRATAQVVRGIYQQKLKGILPQTEINDRAGRALETLTHSAETFAKEFVKRVRESGSKKDLADFAIDICPVWDDARGELRYVLLEVQYGYAFKGLVRVAPKKAQEVQQFRDALRVERKRADLVQGALDFLNIREP